ncbi:MAG: LysR family transcriptional regulator [Streptococcus sp.]|nr:LysR family transcriptional regulator [Streptococcus sp.]
MNFNDINIFMVIYETKSLNKSAKILQYAQSNLSSRLKVMEDELNKKLFIRNYSGLIPTDSGKQFYKFCKETSSNLEKLKKSISLSKTSILISELLLNNDINNSNKIDFLTSEITIQKTSDIPILAREGDFDEIFCFKKIENLKNYNMSSENLEVIYFCSKTIAEFENLPVLVNKDKACPLRNQTLIDFPNIQGAIEIDSFENIISLVEDGKGIALLPEWMKKRSSLKQYNQEKILIPYYHYEKNCNL